MLLVDSHCHLNFEQLQPELPCLLSRMQEKGVGWALCAGVTLEDFPQVLQLAQQHRNIFAAAAVHPCHQEGEGIDFQKLQQYARQQEVVAVGETGLDYYRANGDMQWQKQRFIQHIGIARELKKPLIIHMREATEDCLRILGDEKAHEVGGVLHCYTEDLATATRLLDIGFYISLSGIVTFKNAHKLHEVARELPLSSLLIETDAPYLAPVPMRGKRNEPAYVRYVAEFISNIRDIAYEELASITTGNFFRLFGLAQRT